MFVHCLFLYNNYFSIFNKLVLGSPHRMPQHVFSKVYVKCGNEYLEPVNDVELRAFDDASSQE